MCCETARGGQRGRTRGWDDARGTARACGGGGGGWLREMVRVGGCLERTASRWRARGGGPWETAWAGARVGGWRRRARVLEAQREAGRAGVTRDVGAGAMSFTVRARAGAWRRWHEVHPRPGRPSRCASRTRARRLPSPPPLPRHGRLPSPPPRARISRQSSRDSPHPHHLPQPPTAAATACPRRPPRVIPPACAPTLSPSRCLAHMHRIYIYIYMYLLCSYNK